MKPPKRVMRKWSQLRVWNRGVTFGSDFVVAMSLGFYGAVAGGPASGRANAQCERMCSSFPDLHGSDPGFPDVG